MASCFLCLLSEGKRGQVFMEVVVVVVVVIRSPKSGSSQLF